MDIRIYSNGFITGIIPSVTRVKINKYDFYAYNDKGFVGIFGFSLGLEYILRGV